MYVYTYISSETAIACPIAHLVGEAHPLGEEGHEEAVGDDAEDEEVEAQGLLPAVPQVDDLWIHVCVCEQKEDDWLADECVHVEG